MKTLTFLSVASAVALAGTLAYAQPAPPPPGGPGGPGGRRPAMTRADFDALTDARVAAIQAGLKLTPDQQKLWGPVEQALRARAVARIERVEQRRQQGPGAERPDLMQRLERGAATATKNAENLNALSTAMKPLWASLDDRQKRLLPILMNAGRPGPGAGRRFGRMAMMGGPGTMRGPHMMQPGGRPPAPPAPQQ